MKRMRKSILLILIIGNSIMIPHSIAEKNDSISIVVDLWTSELFVLNGDNTVKKYKIAPGKLDSPTPIGEYTVIMKSRDWGRGFGTRWLGLDVPWGIYGIHGTNKPWLIGSNVSGGCIRMRNHDVEELFEYIPIGAKVFIRGPITGMEDGEIRPISLGSKGNLVQLVQQRLKMGGYYYGTINGIYGEQMEAAVKRFQKNHHLHVTGGVGQKEYIYLGILE